MRHAHRIVAICCWAFGLFASLTNGLGGTGATATADEPRQPANRPANRLARETSPYLLQHAHNPVDWYPWGDEALTKAKKENKLIFLSIGYSSCHWCHVMERESFLDDEIAALLNKHYVCVKIDREERPDVDSIYMTALRVFNRLTRSGRGGGWPLSMILTPDAEPFFGGTYFPARDGDRGAPVGFLTIVKRVQEIWAAEPAKVRADAKTLSQFTKTELEEQRVAPMAKLNAAMLDEVQSALTEQFDSRYGGFGFDESQSQRPKFPEASNLFYLLDRTQRRIAANKSPSPAREQLLATLEKMAQGGIRDHLGGGFHRYSVDRFWRIPHYEKMLYDNGQLASAYAEAYKLTGRADFRRVTVEILEFVLRELTDPQGGFYAALDADSEGEEGKYYVWDKQEVVQTLSADEFELFGPIYGLNGEPNFEERWYAPQMTRPLAAVAAERKETEEALDKRLAPIRVKLLAVRSRRTRPGTDTKILTSWNGLMIRGFADAGRLLDEPRYVAAAERAADFILNNLRTADGRLQRTYGKGQAKLNAYLDDYAFLTDGLIALHRATGQKKWLDAAVQITDRQIQLFWDEKGGAFFFTSSDHESLLARGKELADSAEPSGNSVAAGNLAYLARETKNAAYRVKAEQTIQAASMIWLTAPAALPRMAVSAANLLEPMP